jgi:hypothetical protein
VASLFASLRFGHRRRHYERALLLTAITCRSRSPIERQEQIVCCRSTLGCRMTPAAESSRWQFSPRTAGPLRNLTFAEPRASGHARRQPDTPETMPNERLHPTVANWRSRPISDIRRSRFVAAKQTVAVRRRELACTYLRASSGCNRIRSTSAGMATRLTTIGQISIGGAATRVDGRFTTFRSSLRNSLWPQRRAWQASRIPGHSRQWQTRPMYCPLGSAKKMSAPLLRVWA